MKTSIAMLTLLVLGAGSAASAQDPVVPAQQAPATPPPQVAPAQVVPAAPGPPPGYPPPPVYVTPAQRPFPPPPHRLPPPQFHPLRPKPPRVYGNAGAPFSFGIGGGLAWRNEDHARFGTQDGNGALDVFASYDVWAPSRVFVLSFGLSYRYDQRPRTQLAELTENLLTADLTARMRAASWLWPHLRAGAGVALTRVDVRDREGGISLDDRAPGAAGSFGAGVTLRTPTRALETHGGKLASLSIGVMFEGGYTLAQDAELTPQPKHGGDVRRASPTSFQSERSAAFLRVLGVARF